jgi:predicted chitinase
LHITLLVNGGYNGLPERVEGTERAKTEFLLAD